MKIYFLSPNLTGDGIKGHYCNYLKSIENCFSKNDNIEMIIVSSIEASDSLISNFRRILRHFLVYDSSFLNKQNSQFQRIVNSIRLYKDLVRLRKVLGKETRNDILFCDTISDSEILGWLLFVVFNYSWINYRFKNLVFILRFRPIKNSILLTTYVMVLEFLLFRFFIKIFKLNVLLFTDSELLKNDYKKLLGINIDLLPIPIEKVHFNLLKSGYSEVECFNVLFIGGSQPHKGFDFMVLFLDKYFSLPMFRRDVIFNIQIDLNNKYEVSRVNPKILKLFNNLKERYNYQIKIIDSRIANEDYYKLFQNSNFVFLPYSSSHFKSATSNIFTESVFFQVIPVVPNRTWMSYELQTNDFEESIVDLNDLDKSYEVFSNLINNYSYILECFNEKMKKFREFNCSDNFHNTIISYFK